MAEPKCAQNAPYEVDAKPGKYYWCSCGLSEKQPFCDGKHKVAGEFTPKQFEITEEKKVWLCGCKKTANPPYCDGTHKK